MLTGAGDTFFFGIRGLEQEIYRCPHILGGLVNFSAPASLMQKLRPYKTSSSLFYRKP
jgi:hypothetical protein